MIHASGELCGAMMGLSFAGADYVEPACGAPHYETAIWGWSGMLAENDGHDSLTDEQRVDCPACLLLVRSADPVRWDACEERGLNPKLETK